MSSNPTTLTSSGTRPPAAVSPWITPKASWSLKVITADDRDRATSAAT